MNYATFLIGMTAGAMVGAGVSMMHPKQSRHMKQEVDESIHKFASAIESAYETMKTEIH